MWTTRYFTYSCQDESVCTIQCYLQQAYSAPALTFPQASRGASTTTAVWDMQETCAPSHCCIRTRIPYSALSFYRFSERSCYCFSTLVLHYRYRTSASNRTREIISLQSLIIKFWISQMLEIQQWPKLLDHIHFLSFFSTFRNVFSLVLNCIIVWTLKVLLVHYSIITWHTFSYNISEKYNFFPQTEQMGWWKLPFWLFHAPKLCQCINEFILFLPSWKLHYSQQAIAIWSLDQVKLSVVPKMTINRSEKIISMLKTFNKKKTTSTGRSQRESVH